MYMFYVEGPWNVCVITKSQKAVMNIATEYDVMLFDTVSWLFWDVTW